MVNLTNIPQNYKNNVDWITGAYTDAGVAFPNGFQKDAIQNAVGARKTDKWKNWSCDISLIENRHGCFVIVEDFGTVGLTGENTPAEIINKKMAQGENLPPIERLSRFTSMFIQVEIKLVEVFLVLVKVFTQLHQKHTHTILIH